ncbi:MAG TPA: hypothetical protein VF681_12525 [Abditibacteriaceae bacterium]
MSDNFSVARSARLVVSLFVRALRSAFFGFLAGAFIGGFNGVWSGAIMGLINPNQPTLSSKLSGIFFHAYGGAIVATVIGAVSGTVAFFLLPLIAWRRDINEFLFLPVVAKKTSWGALWGGLVMAVNFSLYAWLFTKAFTFSTTVVGYYYGVISGFVIGFFFGTIQGALHEAQRQREQINGLI